MVHRLKMPFSVAGRRIQTQQRFCKQIGARPSCAVVVAAGRARRRVQQSAGFVQSHRSPDVRMSGHRPGIVFPSLAAKFTTLRNGVENPHAFAGTRVESLNRSWRIVFVLQAIGDAAADNHQVFVDNRWRALPHFDLFVMIPQSFSEQRVAALTKTAHQLTRSCVDREETIVAVHENARLVAVTPEGNSAMLVIEINTRTVQVGFRVEAPQLFAGFGIQSDHTVERRAQIKHVVDHERRNLKIPGLRLIR